MIRMKDGRNRAGGIDGVILLEHINQIMFTQGEVR
jgi:hypothetical protein